MAPQPAKTTTAVNQGPNLVDILLYLASKWPWFLISLAICLSLAWYKYSTAPRIYHAQTKVIIKDPSNKTSSGGLDRYENSINRVNVTNEILQFRSKRLMQDVVSRLNADVTYTTRQGLHDVNLYGLTPVKATFIDLDPERSMRFELTPLDSTKVRITYSGLEGDEKVSHNSVLKLGTVYKILGTRLMISKTDKMDPEWYGRDIDVVKIPVSAAVKQTIASLGIRQEEEDGTIINIAVTSQSPILDVDILNTLIQVYNEESINDKNQVAINTANFIDERLQIIGNELGGVEKNLEEFRVQNDMVDMGGIVGRYMGESQSYNRDALQFETQLRIAMFIKDYLTDPARYNDLIPANLGINDAAIEGQISHFNSIKLQRDRLAGEGSSDNPVIEELTNTMNTVRRNILSAVDNLIVSIQVKRRDAQKYEMNAESRLKIGRAHV